MKKRMAARLLAKFSNFGVGGGAAQVVAQEGHVTHGEEGTGAGTEKAVIKADGKGDKKGEGALAQAPSGVEIGDPGRKEKIEAEGDQQRGDQPLPADSPGCG